MSALLTPTLSANSTGPKLTVSGVPVAGRQVVAVGTGFNSSYTVQLKWDGSAAGMPSVRVAGSGGFSTTVTIPAAALPGRHSLSAVKAAQAWKQGVPGAGVLASTTVVVLDATTPSATATASGSAVAATPTPAADFTPIPSATGTPTPTSTATPTKTPTPTGTATPTLTSAPTPATTPTSAPAATATPTAVPLPSPAPTSAGLTGLYGSRLVMDALANLEIGGSGGWNKRFAYRFRAVTSSSLVSVRWFKRGVNDGHYGAGTGGDIRVSIQTDNGSGHPSGTILASTLYPSIGTGDDRGFLTTFASPASLTAGKLYHVVWENLASDTAHNFISVNSIYTSGSMVSQPGRSRTDWCVENADRINTAWQDESAYYVSPIADYAYGNGVHDGVGYTIPDVVATAAISGNSQVREVFTVSGGTRSVTDVWFRLRRTSGSDPLKIRLETAAGTLIDQGTVAASSIAIGAPYPSDSVSSWAHVQFAQPHTLSSGSTYHLVLSTAASSTYTIVEVWQERAHGYSSATYFGDGHAERNSGAGWSLFSGNSGHDDFQFYLRG